MSTTQRSAYILLGKSALTGALGGLLFGFDTAVIAGATHPLVRQYALSDKQLGFTVSIALWGTVCGAIGSGWLGQRIGSRAALRIMGLLYLISALGCALAPNWSFFLVARFLGGLGIGGSSVLGPVYIAELAPAKWRGRLVGLFQINIVIGILLAYLSNAVVSHFVQTMAVWRWEFGVTILPALLFLAMLFTVPHSSRWLVSQNRIDEATLILARMGSPDSRAEVDAMRLALEQEGGAAQTRLFSRRYALPIFLAISIGLFNQLTGINAILYYLNDIFGSAGFSNVSANAQAVAIGASNLLATMFGISIIDKLGRKKLLLTGAAGCAACLAGVAILFGTRQHLGLLLPLLIAFIVFFALSQGSVIWVYLSEVFPSNVRSKGQSLGSSSHWVMNALIAQTFPILASHSKSLPFVFFAGMTVVQFFVVLFVYPETKGYSLEEMQAHLGH
ncbi:MAG: sugar porter family MFS transporter [Janthinobacterium lividum]